MDDSVRDRIEKLLKSAQRELEGVDLLMEAELYAAAVSRAYYSMFYVVLAILLLKGLEYSKHSAVISAFGKEFVKTGMIDREYHRKLVAVFEQRIDADYQKTLDVSLVDAKQAVENARVFVYDMHQWIRRYTS